MQKVKIKKESEVPGNAKKPAGFGIQDESQTGDYRE